MDLLENSAYFARAFPFIISMRGCLNVFEERASVSYVADPEEGGWVVGVAADNQRPMNPLHLVSNFGKSTTESIASHATERGPR